MLTDETRAVLRAARELVARGWNQGSYAVDAEGRRTAWGGDDAVAWCAVGATHRSAGRSGPILPAITALRAAVGLPPDVTLPEWNDAPERTQAEVLAALDRAANPEGDNP